MEMLLHGNALLALAAAVLWGGGDFSGGMSVKSAGGTMGAALRVILLSHAVSLGILMAVAWWRGDAFPHGAALVWGLVAGATAGVALACFYVALSRGGDGGFGGVEWITGGGDSGRGVGWRGGVAGDTAASGFSGRGDGDMADRSGAKS